MDNVAFIENLYEEYIRSISAPDGSLLLGRNSNEYRLLENGIKFHECSYEETQACLVYLCKTSLIKNKLVATYDDHLYLWSWCINLLVSRHGSYYDTQQENELERLFKMCSSAAMSIPFMVKKNPMAYVSTYEELHVARKNYFHGEYNDNKHLALSYLCFPLLESVTRKHCKDFVNYKGDVIKSFSITPRDGKPRKYKLSQEGKKTNRISNLCHMLYLVISTSTDERLKNAINTACEIFSYNDEVAFEAIFSWRNSSLHGESNHIGIGAAIFTLSLIIMMDNIKDNYEHYKSIITSYNFEALGGGFFNSSTTYIPDINSLGEVKAKHSF